MKYKCLKSCIIGKSAVKAGDIVDVDGDEAKMLMGIGRIMPHDEVVLEDRSVGLESSSQTVVKRRGRPKNDSRNSF
ncbi:MAG: hypothetical protein ACO23R_02710 [bacterium]